MKDVSNSDFNQRGLAPGDQPGIRPFQNQPMSTGLRGTRFGTIGLVPLIGTVLLLITGCVASTDHSTNREDHWGNDVRSREMEIGPDAGHRIKLTDEVDIMRDVDERQRW